MTKLLLAISLVITLYSTNVQAVTASYYGGKFHGRLTASGERYNMNSLTAAHNSLPFGTKVLVTNLSNNKTVTVRINDRGGFNKYGRTIDLSKKANQILQCGLCQVKIQVLK